MCPSFMRTSYLRTHFYLRRAFACKFSEPQLSYAGTTHYASRKILSSLLAEKVPECSPADDLESMVLCSFALQHPRMAAALSQIPISEYKAIQDLWRKWLDPRVAWKKVLESAVLLDYESVSSGLSDLLS